MGLDMYLYARKYVSGVDYSRTNDEVVATPNPMFTSVINAVGLTTDELSEDFPSATISVKVGYWRKVNAVHQWFVSNVQGGEDNCEEFHVSREQLLELRDVCRKVVADNSLAEELLPPQGGFFFGGTEYDEWYFEGVKATIAILDRILSNPKFEDTGMFSWDFYYQSSW